MKGHTINELHAEGLAKLTTYFEGLHGNDESKIKIIG